MRFQSCTQRKYNIVMIEKKVLIDIDDIRSEHCVLMKYKNMWFR